ncbi:MAG: hypothetical protein ACUVRD_00865 [Bacteroidia bacterium]
MRKLVGLWLMGGVVFAQLTEKGTHERIFELPEGKRAAYWVLSRWGQSDDTLRVGIRLTYVEAHADKLVILDPGPYAEEPFTLMAVDAKGHWLGNTRWFPSEAIDERALAR